MTTDEGKAFDRDDAPASSSIDWDSSKLTPQFLRALAKAQASLDTIGKESWQKKQEYFYAAADAVLNEIRRAFAPVGISIVTSFSQRRPPQGQDKVRESSQWIDWIVRLDWALMYGGTGEAAESSEVAYLRGWAETVAVGSKGRPPDKSLYAARTSLSGYIALGLSAADRATVPKSEDIEQRDDGRSEDESEAARIQREVDSGIKTIFAARRAAGLPKLNGPELIERVNGKPMGAGREAWLELHANVIGYLESIDENIEKEIEESSGDPTDKEAP